MDIRIDISPILAEFQLDTRTTNIVVNNVVQDVTKAVYVNWRSMAKRNLRSTRNRYMDGLLVVDEGLFKGAIVLTGRLNNMLENGVGAFDMKKGFQGNPNGKLKTTKDGGWYLTIPFRMASAGALGESEAFSSVLPDEVYQIAKTLKGTSARQTEPEKGKVFSGTSLKSSDLPSKYQIPKSRAGVSNIETQKTFDEYVHKTSIYVGLVRNEKTYEKATQGSYVTFRRVSSKSDPSSWINRGIVAYNLADKAIKNLDIVSTTEMSIQSSLNNLKIL